MTSIEQIKDSICNINNSIDILKQILKTNKIENPELLEKISCTAFTSIITTYFEENNNLAINFIKSHIEKLEQNKKTL